MVSWSTVQSLVLFIGPLLLPRILATYKSIRNRPAAQIKPISKQTSYALGVLFASGVVAFLSTFPVFSSPNIFSQTSSRLQTSAGVLMTRLSALRPLTPTDEKLRSVLDAGGLDARLLYVRYGPDVLINCPFAAPNDADSRRTYLFYALPNLLTPHLLHLIALGIATSGLLSGAEGRRWRTPAAIAGVLLAAAELLFLANYDDAHNLRSTRLAEIDFVHWKMQVWRGLAIAALDAGLGWVIWLQASGRAFAGPPSASERVAQHTRVLEGVLRKINGVGVLRNGVVRDPALRARVDEYWRREGEVMKDVLEQGAVLEAQRHALRRNDVGRLARDAELHVANVVPGMIPE